ncbi:MAG: hypothetical protein IJZ34_11550 [Lachnospiraceae bacterium]|nr:hypothetical protein [Lachnospiraceae bacterium]
MYWKMMYVKYVLQEKCQDLKEKCLKAKHPGIDGILVTVGLCIIALVLCVIMKDSLGKFITTIVDNMTGKATEMLQYTPPAGA